VSEFAVGAITPEVAAPDRARAAPDRIESASTAEVGEWEDDDKSLSGSVCGDARRRGDCGEAAPAVEDPAPPGSLPVLPPADDREGDPGEDSLEPAAVCPGASAWDREPVSPLLARGHTR
jgi:hypothetical protein